MFKELENIAKDITNNYITEAEAPDIVTQTIMEALDKVDEDSKYYICESCGMTVTNKVFHYGHGSCMNCGNKLNTLTESDNAALFEEKRYTCPSCKASLPFNKYTEQHECKVCGKLMDLYVPYKKN